MDFLFRLFAHHNTSSYVGWVGRLHTYSYSSDFFIVFFTKISGGKYGKMSISEKAHKIMVRCDPAVRHSAVKKMTFSDL